MLYIAHPLAINLPCLHFKCGKIPSCTSLDTRSNNGLLRSASFFWLVKQSRRTWKEYWCKMLPQGELILLYLCVCVCVCVGDKSRRDRSSCSIRHLANQVKPRPQLERPSPFSRPPMVFSPPSDLTEAWSWEKPSVRPAAVLCYSSLFHFLSNNQR